VNRTGAALGNTAAKLGAAELEIFPDHPKQGDIRFHLNGVGLSVNFECDGLSHGFAPFLVRSLDRRSHHPEYLMHSFRKARTAPVSWKTNTLVDRILSR
jgi:hypothetical protein